jgi:hypothetical protein
VADAQNAETARPTQASRAQFRRELLQIDCCRWGVARPQPGVLSANHRHPSCVLQHPPPISPSAPHQIYVAGRSFRRHGPGSAVLSELRVPKTPLLSSSTLGCARPSLRSSPFLFASSAIGDILASLWDGSQQAMDTRRRIGQSNHAPLRRRCSRTLARWYPGSDTAATVCSIGASPVNS